MANLPAKSSLPAIVAASFAAIAASVCCVVPLVLVLIKALGAAYEREQSPAARDAIAQILTNSRMCAEGHRPADVERSGFQCQLR